MRFLFIVYILFCIQSNLISRDFEVKIYSETNAGITDFLVDNDEYFPVTIEFEFDLKNMKSTLGAHFTVVVPAKTMKHVVTKLTVDDAKKVYGYKVKTGLTMGDINASVDMGFVYELPYQVGSTYKVFQGYNGKITHKGENALDFSMAVGDVITASRDGIVVEVVQKNSRTCFDPECVKYNNFILILHSDGSFAEYTHIMKDGSLVQAGDTIAIGEQIGYSGKVGYASGPHLHFEVYVPSKRGKKTLKTLFRTENETSELLVEGKSYIRVKN